MPKKSAVNIPRIAVLRIIVFSLIGFGLWTGYVDAVDFLTTSPLFQIKDVMIDRSIQFIDLHSLKDLQGTNIFKADIAGIDRQISRRYPYIAQLRVVRRLPDRILVLAKKRDPLLQIYHKNKYLTLDTEGVALYYTLKPMGLPQVSGVPLESGLFLGGHIGGGQLQTVVGILNMFRTEPSLKRWRIHAVAAGNPAKIDVSVGQNMHVILDQEDTKDKIDLLQMMVAANKINLDLVKYIDLRFKEPVIAGQAAGS